MNKAQLARYIVESMGKDPDACWGLVERFQKNKKAVLLAMYERAKVLKGIIDKPEQSKGEREDG